MAYISFADLRSASVAEFAQQLTLTTAEASDDNLTAAIIRFSQRFDDFTNDHFESAGLTLELDGEGEGRIYLPRRTTAVATVNIRDETGTLTTQDTTSYRLHSSLVAGTTRSGDWDWLDAVPFGVGFAGVPVTNSNVWCWPGGPQTVQVTGAFGWTVTPGDVKRAVALMVFDHFKPIRNDLRRTQSFTTDSAAINLAITKPTGIPECDDIIEEYRRESRPGA